MAPFLARFHRLTVDDGRAGSRLASLLHPRLFPQRRVDALPGAIVAPRAKIAPDRRPRRKVMWQSPPLASRAVQIQDGIDHLAHVGRARMPAWLSRRDQGVQDGPLLVGQITQVALSSHAHPPRRLRVLF